jgi:AcrR family transcriptional regulator
VIDEPGLRQRKKLQTRTRIEAAALDLFERQGFDGTTVEEIAGAAQIAPRTFFSYFPTKEDVVLADYAGRLERIVEQLGDRPHTETPWAALRASFVVVAADYDTQRHELVRRFRIMADSASVHARSLQLQSGWEDALAAALGARLGDDTESLTSRLLASAALSAMRSSQRHWIATGQTTPLPTLVESCFDQLADGLGDLH